MVSYDAKVFDYCMEGDVAGLQKLFASGQASPFEKDPEGRTPLHVSSYEPPQILTHHTDDRGSTPLYTRVPRFASS